MGIPVVIEERRVIDRREGIELEALIWLNPSYSKRMGD